MFLISIKESLLKAPRSLKIVIASLFDIIAISFATYLSLRVSGTYLIDLSFLDAMKLVWLPLFSVFIFYLMGVYRSIVRYIDFSFFYVVIRAILLVFVLNLILKFLFIEISKSLDINPLYSVQLISRGGWIMGLAATLILILGSRVVASSFLLTTNPEKRVVIYGAGSAGIQLARALRGTKEMQPIAFIDHNLNKQNTYMLGIKVLAPHKLERILSRKRVDEVLIAMPSASRSTLRDLLKEIESYSVKVRILPGLAELAQGKISVAELKEVDISDLLGRSEVEANKELLTKDIKNKTVLITGGGGSIGSEIAKQVALQEVKHLIILDTNEFSLYSTKKEIESKYPHLDLSTVICSVTNKLRMIEIFKSFEVNTIYHTAAYKHVPLVEENPFEGVDNNIYGTKYAIEAAIEARVETFVLISTDKAVRPTNIMGATKRLSEMILQSLSKEKSLSLETRMTMVRFGNVLGSSGSAIPLFQQQIKDGGPVTVTDPNIIRYFMSISEAAELVIQAGAMGKGGDVFVLDMGEPVKIYELAKRLINLSGYEVKDDENSGGDIEIIFTGLRPGEKLYEELLIGENVSKTIHKQIWRAEEDTLTIDEIEYFLELIIKAREKNDINALKQILKEAVLGFMPQKEIVDMIHLQKNHQ